MLKTVHTHNWSESIPPPYEIIEAVIMMLLLTEEPKIKGRTSGSGGVVTLLADHDALWGVL